MTPLLSAVAERVSVYSCALLISRCFRPSCSGQTSAGSVSGFMMALANTYGLLFIILLLGQGLIQVPRQLWETSFNDKELQRLYFNATQVRL